MGASKWPSSNFRGITHLQSPHHKIACSCPLYKIRPPAISLLEELLCNPHLELITPVNKASLKEILFEWKQQVYIYLYQEALVWSSKSLLFIKRLELETARLSCLQEALRGWLSVDVTFSKVHTRRSNRLTMRRWFSKSPYIFRPAGRTAGFKCPYKVLVRSL